MAYDEVLAARVRALLAARADVVEKTMFGGLAFMVRGQMTVGLVSDDLMVRVAPDEGERLLVEPHVRPMDFTGRPMRGWLFVEPEGVRTPAALRAWVQRALARTDAPPAGPARRAIAPRPIRRATPAAADRRRNPRTARAATAPGRRRRR